MKLEQQVCNLDLAKRLKELGVKQESLYFHRGVSNNTDPVNWYYSWSIVDNLQEATESHNNARLQYFSAFTVAELGEMLPDNFHTYRKGGDKQYWCGMDIKLYDINDSDWWNHEEGPTEADARAKMLIYLLENNLTHPTKP